MDSPARPATVDEVLRRLRQEVTSALREGPPHGVRPARVRLDLALVLGADEPTGAGVLRPVARAPESGPDRNPRDHQLTVEWDFSAGSSGPGMSVPAAAGRPAAHASPAPLPCSEEESVTGGDGATLARRLQLILGGPPGFTTGAKAEVLADLLSEFGRATLLETLRRDWIREFDTGAEASSAMSGGAAGS